MDANLQYILKRIPLKYIVIEKIPSIKISVKSNIPIICSCGQEQIIQIASVQRTINRTGKYQCVKCGLKEKYENDPSYVKSISIGVSKSWTDVKKERQSVISKNMWFKDGFRELQRNKSIAAWDDAEKRKKA